MGKYSYLTFDQRREIESLYNDGNRVVDIASKIQRSVAAVYEELKRGSTGELDENKRLKYNAYRKRRMKNVIYQLLRLNFWKTVS